MLRECLTRVHDLGPNGEVLRTLVFKDEKLAVPVKSWANPTELDGIAPRVAPPRPQI